MSYGVRSYVRRIVLTGHQASGLSKAEATLIQERELLLGLVSGLDSGFARSI